MLDTKILNGTFNFRKFKVDLNPPLRILKTLQDFFDNEKIRVTKVFLSYKHLNVKLRVW